MTSGYEPNKQNETRNRKSKTMAQIKKIKTVELTLDQDELTTLYNALNTKKDAEEEKFGVGNAFHNTLEMIEVVKESLKFVK